MRTLLLVQVVLCAFHMLGGYVAAQPKDVNAWSKARWGMSETEFLKAFPDDIRKLDKQATYKDEAYATLSIPDFEISGNKYDVRFIMDSTDKLRQITIALQRENHPAAEVILTGLEESLVERYGPSVYRNETRTPDKRVGGVVLEGRVSFKAMWKFPTTVIELSYLELRSIKTRLVTVIYRDASKPISGSDKL